jgi:heme exporter protein D
VLLLAPFAATLVPPFYAREQPSIGGWPFFYWWQFAWVVITALIVAVVYRVTTRREVRGQPPADARRASVNQSESRPGSPPPEQRA